MSGKKNLAHGNISVEILDDDLDVVGDPPPAPKNKVGFDEIWVVADVYVFTKGKDKDKEYKKVENQRDTFPKGITFTVDVPADADTWTKQKSKRQLSLVYFDKSKDKWVTFEGQKRAGNVVTVTLKKWIKDPPLGWGGTEPK